MRLPIAVAVVAFAASSGSAMAADCTKGLLWPYVRNTGDCLTDAEIKAGQTGAYSGPATGPVDVSTIKAPPAPPANATDAKTADCKRGWFWPFGGDSDCQSTVQRSGTSAATVSVSGTTPPASVSDPAAATPASQAIQPAAEPQVAVVAKPPKINRPAAVTLNAADCHKGLLWPFVRDSGDCPTRIEKGSSSMAAVPVQTSVPSSAPATAIPASPRPAAAATVAATTTSAGSCGKGLFWPFVRNTGDCRTAGEKGNGSTAAVPESSGPVVTPVASTTALPGAASAMPVAASPRENTPASDAASCHKGLFWPFVREAGDCATDVDRGVRRGG